jgi:ribosomal protein L7/L12
MKPSKILNQIKKLSKAELDVLITHLMNEGFIAGTVSGGNSTKSKDKVMSLWLTSIKENRKLYVVKELKNSLEIGLKEAADIVNNLPCVVLTGDSKTLQNLEILLVEAGGIVDIH